MQDLPYSATPELAGSDFLLSKLSTTMANKNEARRMPINPIVKRKNVLLKNLFMILVYQTRFLWKILVVITVLILVLILVIFVFQDSAQNNTP